MPLRTPRDPIGVSGVLTALANILPQNTNFQAQGGTVYINDWTAIEQGRAQLPCLVIESGPKTTKRIGLLIWQTTAVFRVVYLDRWDQQTLTINQIWENLEADMQRMEANLEDNPTLLYNGVNNARNINKIDVSQYAAQKDDRFPVMTVRRTMMLTLHLPEFTSTR